MTIVGESGWPGGQLHHGRCGEVAHCRRLRRRFYWRVARAAGLTLKKGKVDEHLGDVRPCDDERSACVVPSSGLGDVALSIGLASPARARQDCVP